LLQVAITVEVTLDLGGEHLRGGAVLGRRGEGVGAHPIELECDVAIRRALRR
jgi:hypothetical protein